MKERERESESESIIFVPGQQYGAVSSTWTFSPTFFPREWATNELEKYGRDCACSHRTHPSRLSFSLSFCLFLPHSLSYIFICSIFLSLALTTRTVSFCETELS